MKKLILFISLIISIAASAQTYNGNITLLTQQDVDNFSVNYPGINSVNGTLIVGDQNGNSNITNVDSLQRLVSITNFRFFKTQIQNLTGFNNLISCSWFQLWNNNTLQSFSGFNNITSLNNLTIEGSNTLNTMNSFQNLQTLGNLFIGYCSLNSISLPGLNSLNDLFIDYCPNISNLNGLTQLVSLNNLTIRGSLYNFNFSNYSFLNNLTSLSLESCPNQSSLSGISFNPNMTNLKIISCNNITNLNDLNNVTKINNLNLSVLPNLNNLSGLNNLNQIPSYFVIENTNLQNLNELNLLTSIGTINILNNIVLNNINGLNHPITISGSVNIMGNTNLSNCSAQAICNYLGVNSVNATIAGNATGCNSISEVTYACNPVPLTKIRTQDCGLQTTTFNQLFYCNSITGATYEFRYRDISTNAVSTKTRVNTAASFGDAGLFDINRTYSVRVRAKLNGVYGNYGDSCLIYSPIQIPLTKIRTIDCGLQTTTFNQLFYTDAVSYASSYEFEYTDLNTNAITYKVRLNTAASLGDAGLLDINKTYNVRVRAKVGNNWGAFGTICQIKSPITVPETKIRTQDCGLQTTTFNQLFYADVVTYSTGNYDFEFTDIATNIVTIKSRPNNIASLGDAGLFELNKTYSVRVRTKVGNNWGNYGTACLIYSPTQVPLTKIRTQDCGLQTTTFIQLYYADAVSYATNYEFEYVDINTNAITYRVRLNNAASLGDAGLNQYNKIYNVRVRAKVGNNWGAFGTVCQIKSPINVPVTQVNSVHCNVAYSIPDLFYCDPVANANAYEFEFTNTTTNVITSNIVTTTANSFATAGLPYYSKTYSVRVKAKIGTTWGSYGAPCILKSICSTCLRLVSNDASTIDESKNTSTIVIYPNPTTDVLNITELTESTIINVFNVSGQLVLTKSSIDTNEKIDLSSLDNGIYMIVIEGKNGEIAKRQRVVLAK
jgi:hypothetical protein